MLAEVFTENWNSEIHQTVDPHVRTVGSSFAYGPFPSGVLFNTSLRYFGSISNYVTRAEEEMVYVLRDKLLLYLKKFVIYKKLGL